jgi:hypothetical protein
MNTANFLQDQQPDPPIKVASVSEKTEVCLSSLGAIDQTLFLSQILNRSKNAGGWILENRKYISWLESSKADLLWITAKAGCGKTTLSSHISQMVKELRPSEAQAFKTINLKPVVLFFFFHTSNLEIEGNATGALRNIVRQLVGQVPNSLPAVLERYELLSSRGNFEWSSENLLSMIRDMLQLVPAGSFVYIILDALDECEPDSRRWLLDWLKELVNEETSRETVTLSRSLLKIVVTSRPDEDIFDSLSDFPTLEMTASDTAIDMHTLIHSRISGFSRRRHLDVAASRKIISFLEENAHGMFLWAVLIIQDLERRDERLSDEVITAKLSSIPLTLFNTYETILKKVSPSRKKDMWRIFRWLLFAKRGLTFTELEIALCLETGVSRWHDFAGDVNFLCGAFLRFDGSRGEINMVHQTARDFLESFVRLANPEDVAGLDMSYREANAHLAQICIQYLLRDEEFSELCGLCDKKGPPIFPSVRWLQNFLGRHPFLYYAIENWASHVHALETPSTTLFNLVRTLFNSEKQKDGIKALTCFIDHGGRGALPMRQHPVHLAAYFNLPWFVEYCISLDSSAIHEVTTMNDTPLIWASEQGSTECVKILLEAGANPDNFEWDGWSSLHWAARNGHVEVVKLLIDHGATLDHKDSKGNTPLEWAADREHWDVVEALKSRVGKKELAKLEKFTRNKHPASVIVSASRSRKGRLLRHGGPSFRRRKVQ